MKPSTNYWTVQDIEELVCGIGCLTINNTANVGVNLYKITGQINVS